MYSIYSEQGSVFSVGYSHWTVHTYTSGTINWVATNLSGGPNGNVINATINGPNGNANIYFSASGTYSVCATPINACGSGGSACINVTVY